MNAYPEWDLGWLYEAFLPNYCPFLPEDQHYRIRLLRAVKPWTDDELQEERDNATLTTSQGANSDRPTDLAN